MEILIEFGLEILLAALLAVITWFCNHYLKLEIDGKLEDLLQNALRYGKKVAADRLGAQASQVEFEHKAVKEAVNMVCTKAPKWLKKVGVDADFVQKKIEALLYEESAPPSGAGG